MNDQGQRKERAFAPTIAPTDPKAERLAMAATIPPRSTESPEPTAKPSLGSDPTMMGLAAEPVAAAAAKPSFGSDPTMMGLVAEPAAAAAAKPSLGSDPTMMGLVAEPAAAAAVKPSFGRDPTMMGLVAEPAAAAAVKPSFGSDPTMMGLVAEPAVAAAAKPSFGSDPTMMGLVAEPAAAAAAKPSFGSDPTMMGLPAEPTPTAKASFGSDPTMMGLPAEPVAAAAASFGSDPTMMGLPAEHSLPVVPAPAAPMAHPIVHAGSSVPTMMPVVMPAPSYGAPHRSRRTLVLAGAIVAALGLGGAIWAARRSQAPKPADTSVQSGSTPKAVAAPESKRGLEPPPDPDLAKSDKDGGGRPRPVRRLGRRLGL